MQSVQYYPKGKNPITFISRTLNPTEQNYATNEKEILAIGWALQKLRNYLYGISDLTIFTDHQSLIYSISERNPNTKLKRWKNFITVFVVSTSHFRTIYKQNRKKCVRYTLNQIQCC